MNNLVKKDFFDFYPSRNEFISPLSKIMDQWFNDQFPDLTKTFNQGIFTRGSYPKIDIIDFEDRVEIDAEIAGLTKDDIKIKLNNNNLCISGCKKIDKNIEDKDGGTYLYKEIKRTSFERNIALGDSLDTSQLKAKFSDGLLNISIPKKIEEIKDKEKIIEIE